MDQSHATARPLALPLSLPAVLAFASVAAIVWALVACPPWTVDDAYITFRQARHLVEHGVYSWDLATPVDACTGLVGPLVAAGALALGLAPEIAVDAFGLAGLVALVWAVCRLARPGGPWAISGTLAALAICSPLAPHALSGLETIPFAALVACSLVAFDGRRWRALSALLFAASLTRPEGCLLAGLALGWLVWRERRRAIVPVALYAVPSVLYGLWRVWYFGALLPVPAMRKLGAGWSSEFAERALALAVSLYGVPAVALTVALAIAWIYGARPRVAAKGWLALGSVFALACSSLYLRTEPVMDYLGRYALAVWLPVLAPALGLALAAAVEACGRAPREARRLTMLAAAPLLALSAIWTAIGYDFAFGLPRDHGEVQVQQSEATARYLAEHLAPGEAIATVIDAGLIPYRTDAPTVDCGGLGTVAFAREPTNVDPVFETSPRAIVIASTDWHTCEPMHQPGPQILADPRFAPYRLAAKFRTMPSRGLGWSYYYFVYTRDSFVSDSAELATLITDGTVVRHFE